MPNVKNFRDAVLTIKDGSGTPKTLVVSVAEGNLSFTVKKPTFTIRNRGKIIARKEGNEEEMDVSFSVKFEQWSADTASTGLSVPDVLLQKGNTIGQTPATNNWVNTDTQGCAPWAVDLEFKIFKTCDQTATGDYETIVLPKFHATEVKFNEGEEANMIEVTGTCLAFEPTRTYTDVP